MNKTIHLGKEIQLPNFQLAIAGRPHGFHPGLAVGYSQLPSEMVLEKVEPSGEDLTIYYRHEALRLYSDYGCTGGALQPYI